MTSLTHLPPYPVLLFSDVPFYWPKYILNSSGRKLRQQITFLNTHLKTTVFSSKHYFFYTCLKFINLWMQLNRLRASVECIYVMFCIYKEFLVMWCSSSDRSWEFTSSTVSLNYCSLEVPNAAAACG